MTMMSGAKVFVLMILADFYAFHVLEILKTFRVSKRTGIMVLYVLSTKKEGISMNKIITIGRELGSGGRELGRRLAENLGYAYYDQEILEEIAKRTELSEKYVKSIVERKPMLSFPIHI